MKDITTSTPEFTLEDFDVTKHALVCYKDHSFTHGDIGFLKQYDVDSWRFIWRKMDGRGMFGKHNSIEEAINVAEDNDYIVKVITKEDFE